MRRDDHTYTRSCRGQENIQAIEKRTTCSTLWMCEQIVWRLRKNRLDRGEIEKRIIFLSPDLLAELEMYLLHKGRYRYAPLTSLRVTVR